MRTSAPGKIGTARDAQTFANRCVARRWFWPYILSVRPHLSALIHVNRPRIKAEWRRRLRIEPADTPLANPDIMIYLLMDETLAQLEALVRARPASRWLTLRKTHLEPLRSLCPCGLNPLLVYFGTGVEALKLVLAENLTKGKKLRLCEAWHFLAQSEIEALCEGCHRVCVPSLSFPSDENE